MDVTALLLDIRWGFFVSALAADERAETERDRIDKTAMDKDLKANMTRYS